MIWAMLHGAFAGTSVSIDKGLVVEDAESHVKFDAHLLMAGRVTLDAQSGKVAPVIQWMRPDFRIALGDLPVKARLQLEFAGTPSLLDAYVDIGSSQLYLRVGRMLLPTGRAQLTPVAKLMFQGFAPSADSSRHGRELGAMSTWTPKPGRVDLGVFGNGVDEAVGWRVVGRATIDLAGTVPYDETIALQAHADPAVSIGASAQWWSVDESTTAAMELVAQAGPARLQGEAFVDTKGHSGAYVQVSTAIVPKYLDAAARLDRNVTDDGVQGRIEAVTSGYFAGPHLRVQLAYLHDLAKEKTADSVRVDGQVWF